MLGNGCVKAKKEAWVDNFRSEKDFLVHIPALKQIINQEMEI